MNVADKRIVMTGVTGFIGGCVAQRLLEEGAQVYALVRPESKGKLAIRGQNRLHLIEGSFFSMTEYVSQIGRADAFFHFAWGGVNREEIDSDRVQKQNVDGSLECLAAAKALGCQVFFDAGSRVEYGITEDGVMEETMDCHPVNAYGRAKLEFYERAAGLCRQWGMTYYHLRFFSVYGTGDHPWSIISTLVSDLPKGGTVRLSACRHRWNFMDISDAVEAVLLLYLHTESRNGLVRIVNVASSDTRVLRSFVEEIRELCGGNGILEYGSFVQAKEGPLSICPRIDVLKELTDGVYRDRVSFSEGIGRMLRCEEENR